MSGCILLKLCGLLGQCEHKEHCAECVHNTLKSTFLHSPLFHEAINCLTWCQTQSNVLTSRCMLCCCVKVTKRGNADTCAYAVPACVFACMCVPMSITLCAYVCDIWIIEADCWGPEQRSGCCWEQERVSKGGGDRSADLTYRINVLIKEQMARSEEWQTLDRKRGQVQ